MEKYLKYDWDAIEKVIEAESKRIDHAFIGICESWEETQKLIWTQWRGYVPQCEDVFDSAATNCGAMPSMQIVYKNGNKVVIPVGIPFHKYCNHCGFRLNADEECPICMENRVPGAPEAHGEGETTTMAMKTPTNVKTSAPTDAPETALTAAPGNSNALAALSGLNLFNIPAPQVAQDLFPAIKIPYPIEMGEIFKAADLFHAGLFDGKSFQHLGVPYTLSVIAAREASRKLVTNEKGEKSYERAYKPMGAGFDASGPIFEQHCSDPMADRGVSYLVAVISNGTNVALAEIPAFRVLKDYWGLPLHQALSSNGMGVTVKLADHSVNQTASKKNPQSKYLDPKKFNKPENVVVAPLSQEALKALAAVLEAQKDKFLAWAKR